MDGSNRPYDVIRPEKRGPGRPRKYPRALDEMMDREVGYSEASPYEETANKYDDPKKLSLNDTTDTLSKLVLEIHGLLFPSNVEESVGQDVAPESSIDSVRIRLERNIERLGEVRNALRRI